MWISNFLSKFRFAMGSAHHASQFSAKPLRWHKLVPVGTGIAENSVDSAPLPLTLVPQGRWAIGGQLDSGHLLYIAGWPNGSTQNVQGRAGYSSGPECADFPRGQGRS